MNKSNNQKAKSNASSTFAKANKAFRIIIMALLALSVVLFFIGRIFFSEPVEVQAKQYHKGAVAAGDIVEAEIVSGYQLFKSTSYVDSGSGTGYYVDDGLYWLCTSEDGSTFLAKTDSRFVADSGIFGKYYATVSDYDANVDAVLNDGEKSVSPIDSELDYEIRNASGDAGIPNADSSIFANRESYIALFGDYQLNLSATPLTSPNPHKNIFAYPAAAAMAMTIIMIAFNIFFKEKPAQPASAKGKTKKEESDRQEAETQNEE